MTSKTFECNFSDWQERAKLLNQILFPIVNREIDINAPNWKELLENSPHAADESGLRNEIELLFKEIINQFEFFNADQRQQIIDMMAQNDALMYSSVIDVEPDTSQGFRKSMILFVIDDQGKDPRDATLALVRSRKDGEKNGIDVDSIFKEMASISSTRDKYGWGSTRDFFHKH